MIARASSRDELGSRPRFRFLKSPSAEFSFRRRLKVMAGSSHYSSRAICRSEKRVITPRNFPRTVRFSRRVLRSPSSWSTQLVFFLSFPDEVKLSPLISCLQTRTRWHRDSPVRESRRGTKSTREESLEGGVLL